MMSPVLQILLFVSQLWALMSVGYVIATMATLTHKLSRIPKEDRTYRAAVVKETRADMLFFFKLPFLVAVWAVEMCIDIAKGFVALVRGR